MKQLIWCLILSPLLSVSQSFGPIPKSVNQFGFELCKELSDEPDFLLSPVSISTAMAMTYVGALGITQEQIQTVFHYPKESQFYQGFSALQNTLYKKSATSTIAMANKLWADKTRINLKPDFVQKNKMYFRSGLQEISFKNPSYARETINDWVADNTEEKIVDLLEPDMINAETILILTNAIYFKSNWQTEFDSGLTKKGDFTNDGLESIPVDYMFGNGHFNYYETNEVEILELPYVGAEYSFLILLPKKSMAALEDKITIKHTFNIWMSSLNRYNFDLVQVPKFKTDYGVGLKDILSEMGMPNAFHDANFSGIGSSPLGNIAISDVIHKTYMEFNEEGTEAAAATAVIMGARSSTRPSTPKKFIADKPFLYAIRHVPSGTLLFIGKMSNPKY